MKCKTHPDVEAGLTCQECGAEFCRECVKETGDSLCCPACHAAAVERLATQMSAGKGRAKKPKEGRDGGAKKSAQEPAAAKAGKEAGERGPEKAAKGRRREPGTDAGEAKPRRRDRKKAFPGLDEQDDAPRVLLPEEDDEEKAKDAAPLDAAAVNELEAAAPGPGGAAGPVEGEATVDGEPAAGGGEKPQRKQLRKPAGRHAVPKQKKEPRRKPAEAEPEAGDVVSEAGEEFWGEGEARPRARIRSAAKAISMQVPDDYGGEVTPAPSYLKAVLWALLAGAVTGGIYGVIAWLLPRGVPGIFGWFIGFAVGVTVVVASGRHFNWKLGLIAAGVALAFLCIGNVLSRMLMYWFPRNDLYDLIASTQGMLGWFRQSVIDLGEQFLTGWWSLVFVITGATAFLVSFRPWPFRLNTTSPKADPEAGEGITGHVP